MTNEVTSSSKYVSEELTSEVVFMMDSLSAEVIAFDKDLPAFPLLTRAYPASDRRHDWHVLRLDIRKPSSLSTGQVLGRTILFNRYA